MSRKTPLTCQSRKIFLCIRKNKEISKDKIKEFCVENCERWAFIEHKGDIRPTDGVVEGVHYHIVGDFFGSKTPLSTRLNTIVKFFNFDNADGIEIEQYKTFEGSLQYLTHKNQPDKTPHEKEEIITNLSDADFDILYNADIGNVITFDLLYVTCMNANNIIDVIREIGVGNYRTWRSVIWDIWNTLNDNQDYFKK